MTDFSKNPQKCHEILPVGVEFFRASGRTGRQTCRS